MADSSSTSLDPEKPLVPLDPRLVSNFTHQIINPLNGIVGTIDNLIDGTIEGGRRPQRLKAVRAQLSHIIELARNLAYLSQLTTQEGRDGLRKIRTEVRIPEIIIQAAMFFQELAAERGMRIELDDRTTQYTVRGDRDLLRQVFTNIFENAVKYGHRDSVILVHPRAPAEGGLRIDITNKGPGFEAADRERIFELGFRGEAAQALLASGSGLGLYICREVLKTFDATIEAEHSRKLSETTFRIRFPTLQVA